MEEREGLREPDIARQKKNKKKKALKKKHEKKTKKNDEKVKLASYVDDEEKYGYVPQRKRNQDSSVLNIKFMEKGI